MAESNSFRQVLLQALKDTGPVGMGYLPLGIAYGAFAVTSGFPIWFTCLTALIIYAGSMEFTAVGLIMGGMGLFQIAVTAFFVNFRHIFYGITFPLGQIRSRWAKLYSIHALTDEAYALTATYRPRSLRSKTQVSTTKPESAPTVSPTASPDTNSALSTPQSDDNHTIRETSPSPGSSAASGRILPPGPVVFAISVLCHLYWIGGVALGAVVGNFLPANSEALGFALPALFMVLSIDAWRATAPNHRYLAGIALILGLFAWSLAKPYLLVIALTIYTLLLLAQAKYQGRQS